MKHIGAWVQYNDYRNDAARARTVAALVRARCTMASPMLNGYAGETEEQPFRTRPVEHIVAFWEACAAVGIEVIPTTWAMPHASVIDDMFVQCMPILEAVRSSTLILDIEDAWIRAEGAQPFDAAAAQIGSLFQGVDLVLNGIPHTPAAPLRALAKVCGTWSPQAYRHTDNDHVVRPEIVERSVELWEEKFGSDGPRDGWLMGLYARKQPTPPSRYMSPCVAGVYSEGIDSVCYWDVGGMIGRDDVRDYIGSLAPSTTGIHREIDVAALAAARPRVFVRDVVHLQSMLNGWGLNAGLADGVAGPITLAAVVEFQLRRGWPRDGIVDGRMWNQLGGE
jgi:hypothetical protein